MVKFAAFVALIVGVAVAVLLSGLNLPTYLAILVLVCAVGADSLTTWLCTRKRGREGNPIVAVLFKRLGFKGTLVLWWTIWMMIIWFRILPAPESVQTAIAVAYWCVPVNNLIVLRRLTLRARVC